MTFWWPDLHITFLLFSSLHRRTILNLKHSQWQHAMESSLVLSCVKPELISNGSKSVSASSGVDVLIDMATCYIDAHTVWLLAVSVGIVKHLCLNQGHFMRKCWVQLNFFNLQEQVYMYFSKDGITSNFSTQTLCQIRIRTDAQACTHKTILEVSLLFMEPQGEFMKWNE
jgi:hypothetical protein